MRKNIRKTWEKKTREKTYQKKHTRKNIPKKDKHKSVKHKKLKNTEFPLTKETKKDKREKHIPKNKSVWKIKSRVSPYKRNKAIAEAIKEQEGISRKKGQN